MVFIYQTRMHSSRMHTTHSSSHLVEGGSVCLSACWDTSPQVWAWRPLWPDPSTSPLGVGLEMPPPPARPPTSPQMWAWRPPCEQNFWHTLLKILPCPNFIAGQWQIQDFTKEGVPTPQGAGAPTYDFAKFAKKLHEIWSNTRYC